MTAADDSLVFALVGFIFLLLMIMIPAFIWVKLGGHPEGTYRILRKKYFSAIFIDGEGTPQRFPLPSELIKTGAPELPPYFTLKKPLFSNGVGRYYLDKKEQTKHTGRMSQYYFPDNPFPIPIMTLSKNPSISAEGLEKAFNDETMIQFLQVGKEKKEKKSRTGRFLVIGFVAFVIFIIMLSVLKI